MAKKSMIAKNKKNRCSRSLRGERAALVAVIKDANSSYGEKLEAQEALRKLPRDSAKIRIRNRCAMTGRPRGYRKFGLSRIALREQALAGNLTGVTKASW